MNHAGLIKKVKISYSVFPISNTLTALVNFGLSFIALALVMLILNQPFYWSMLMTITILPAILLFSLGIGFALASMFVFFRDVKHLYEIFLTLWMYLTPMFYSISMISNKFIAKIINLNPMTHFVTMFRNIVQWGTIPNIQEFLIVYGWAFLMLVVGYTIFKLNKRKYILYI